MIQETQAQPIIEVTAVPNMLEMEPESWIRELPDYLEHERLPTDQYSATKIKNSSACYLILDGGLHKRWFSRPLMRWLTKNEAKYILGEIHAGSCGSQTIRSQRSILSTCGKQSTNIEEAKRRKTTTDIAQTQGTNPIYTRARNIWSETHSK